MTDYNLENSPLFVYHLMDGTMIMGEESSKSKKHTYVNCALEMSVVDVNTQISFTPYCVMNASSTSSINNKMIISSTPANQILSNIYITFLIGINEAINESIGETIEESDDQSGFNRN